MSSPNKRLQWTEWGGSLRSNVLSKHPHAPAPIPTQLSKKENNTPRQTLLAHFGGNKLETNKSKWTLSYSTSLFPQSMFPDGNSFPSLPEVVGVGGGREKGSGCLFLVPFLWAQMDLEVLLNHTVEGCPLGGPGSINISKDNPRKPRRGTETNKQRRCCSD